MDKRKDLIKEFIIDNKRVEAISDCIDLNSHIAIIGRVGCGKTILVNEIIKEILDNYKETQIYIVSKYLEEYNFTNERVNKIDIRESIDVLRKLRFEDSIHKTIVIDGVDNFMCENYGRKEYEDFGAIIYHLITVGRKRNINLILNYVDKKEISDYILSNVSTKLIAEDNKIGVFNTKERELIKNHRYSKESYIKRNERNKLELKLLDFQVMIGEIFEKCENQVEVEWVKEQLESVVEVCSEERIEDLEL